MRRLVLYIIIGLTSMLSASAKTTFRTIELERLAHILALDADALPEGYSHPTADGLSLTVHLTGQTVDHIGLCLFSEEMRQTGKSPVFDFLERYFLQLKFPPQVKSTESMMRDDQFRFLKGSLEMACQILPGDDFSYSYDNRLYQASWQRSGHAFLVVSFPVEYELISGENKQEAENNLKTDIRNTLIDKTLFRHTGESGHYISEQFSNRLYRYHGELVSDVRHPAESAANMMLSLDATGNYVVRVTQICYGFTKTVFTVPLKQWIAFCRQQGCALYFGVESLKENGDMDGVVMAVNTAENYNHVMTVSISQQVLANRQGVIEARLYPYVPTHQVLNMFAKYRKSNPKTFASK